MVSGNDYDRALSSVAKRRQAFIKQFARLKLAGLRCQMHPRHYNGIDLLILYNRIQFIQHIGLFTQPASSFKRFSKMPVSRM